MRLSTTRHAWRRWQTAAGPWKGWAVCPSLLSPGVERVTLPPSRQPVAAARQIADELAMTLRGGGVMVVLDLEPILGVDVAALLNEWGVANSVLLLPRWAYAKAVLPVDGLLGALVSQARRLGRDDARLPNVAFVLDAERSRPLPSRSASDRRADNRYRLAVADLPDLAALRPRGIGRIVKLSTAHRNQDAADHVGSRGAQSAPRTR